MSYNFKTLAAEISAVNAAYGMQERNIKDLTSEPLPDETTQFQISPIAQTHFVRLPPDLVELGYSLETFDHVRHRPKGIKNIVVLEADSREKGIYTITIPFFAIEEDIQKELEKLLLPF